MNTEKYENFLDTVNLNTAGSKSPLDLKAITKVLGYGLIETIECLRIGEDDGLLKIKKEQFNGGYRFQAVKINEEAYNEYQRKKQKTKSKNKSPSLRLLKPEILMEYNDKNMTLEEISKKLYDEHNLDYPPKQIYNKIRYSKLELKDFKYAKKIKKSLNKNKPNTSNIDTGISKELSGIAKSITYTSDKFTPITDEILTKAIAHSVNGKMDIEEAKLLSQHVLTFMGYGEQILDNVLSPEDRNVFFMLEDNGIMKTAREESTLYDGREWRCHYWLYNREGINKILENISENVEEYPEYSDNLWERVFS